jgi:hypothetical protein
MPAAKKKGAVPADIDIDCADLDDLRRMLAALMSASLHDVISHDQRSSRSISSSLARLPIRLSFA